MYLCQAMLIDVYHNCMDWELQSLDDSSGRLLELFTAISPGAFLLCHVCYGIFTGEITWFPWPVLNYDLANL